MFVGARVGGADVGADVGVAVGVIIDPKGREEVSREKNIMSSMKVMNINIIYSHR